MKSNLCIKLYFSFIQISFSKLTGPGIKPKIFLTQAKNHFDGNFNSIFIYSSSVLTSFTVYDVSYFSLFPTMPRHNLHKVAPLVKSLCKKHNIDYVCLPLFGAFGHIIR